MRAAEMFDRGRRQVDVVVELGVSAKTASRWHRDWLAGGREALSGAGRAGRMPRLSDKQLVGVEAALAEGPKDNGYRALPQGRVVKGWLGRQAFRSWRPGVGEDVGAATDFAKESFGQPCEHLGAEALGVVVVCSIRLVRPFARARPPQHTPGPPEWRARSCGLS